MHVNFSMEKLECKVNAMYQLDPLSLSLIEKPHPISGNERGCGWQDYIIGVMVDIPPS